MKELRKNWKYILLLLAVAAAAYYAGQANNGDIDALRGRLAVVERSASYPSHHASFSRNEDFLEQQRQSRIEDQLHEIRRDIQEREATELREQLLR